MHYTKADIIELPRVKRLNIINSITGIKPGNLIGTLSKEGVSNLAVFSSVVHLGSDPALLGFILRPTTVPRNTMNNILTNKVYTINHIPLDKTKEAHYTSCKFPANESEFAACNFTEEYLEDFEAPFVRESPIKMGMRFIEAIPIPINGTQLIIGQIEQLIFPDQALTEKGYIDLEESIGIGGLNNYYSLEKKATYPFARLNELPEF